MIVKLLVTLFVLVQTSCGPQSSNITPAPAPEKSSPPWDYGDRGVGSLSDETKPFIVGKPSHSCEFKKGEQAQIEEAIVRRATKLQRNKIAIFTMGAPGCGKSSSLDAVLKEIGMTKENFVVIDPDDARSQVSAFIDATHIPNRVHEGKMRAYADATLWCIERGRSIRDGLLSNVLRDQKNYIFDTPCSDNHYCQSQMRAAKNAGYTNYLLAVWAQEKTCIDRGLERASETGRYTSPNYISTTFTSIERDKAFKRLASTADRSFIFDNDGASPKKVYDSSSTPCTQSPACIYFSPS